MDEESKYGEEAQHEELKGDRETWYLGYLCGMEDALTDLNEAFDFLTMGAGLPAVKEFIEQVGTRIGKELEKLTAISKAQAFESLMDEQESEEEEKDDD